MHLQRHFPQELQFFLPSSDIGDLLFLCIGHEGPFIVAMYHRMFLNQVNMRPYTTVGSLL